MANVEPTKAIGVTLIVLSFGLLAWYAADSEEAPKRGVHVAHGTSPVQHAAQGGDGIDEPGRPHEPGTGGPDNPGGTEVEAGSASRAPRPPREAEVGWVSRDAKEAVQRQSVEDNAPGGGACTDRPNFIQAAKETAGAFTGQLNEAAKVSDAEESKVGRELEAELPKHFGSKWDRADDVTKYQAYLQSMVDFLVKNSKRRSLNYRVHLVHDDSFNACAMPGGLLAVNTGLLEGKMAVLTEAELAVVLGHELAHVELRHPMAAYQLAKVLLGTDANAGRILAHVLMTPLSSEMEYAADRRGLELTEMAQYDPFAAPRLWQRMAARDRGDSGGGGLVGTVLGGAEQVLGSHPPAGNRCARTVQQARQLVGQNRWPRYYLGGTNLREHDQTGPKKQH